MAADPKGFFETFRVLESGGSSGTLTTGNVGTGELVAVAVGEGMRVRVSVGEGVFVVAVAVGVGVSVVVGVAVGDGVRVAVGVGVGGGVGVAVGVGVGDGVSVGKGVGVGVGVAVGEGVAVLVGGAVGVGVGWRRPRAEGGPSSTNRRGLPPMKQLTGSLQRAPARVKTYWPLSGVSVQPCPSWFTSMACGAMACTAIVWVTDERFQNTVVVLSPRSMVT